MSWWRRLSEIFDDNDAPPLDSNGTAAMSKEIYDTPAAPTPAPAAPTPAPAPARSSGKPGMEAVFVHDRRPSEALPVMPPFRESGSQAIDIEYRRRMEEMSTAMKKEFQEFSLSGLAYIDKQKSAGGDIAANRAAEDAEAARKRGEEDAARAARRAQEDAMRAKLKAQAEAKWRNERENEEKVLAAKWTGTIRELQAAFDESVAQYIALQAELERKRREEEEAARAAAAALAAQYASQAANAFVDDAEPTISLANQPSLRSFQLVAASDMYRVLQFMCKESGCSVLTAGVKESDRSWWKVLHFMEAHGLSPPVKSSELAGAMFEELDADKDGVIPLAEIGFSLGLLCSGTSRQKMDGAWDCLGQKGDFQDSSSTGPFMISREQVYQCLGFSLRVREQTLAALTSLDDKFSFQCMKSATQPDVNALLKYDGIESKVAEAFRKLNGNSSEQVEVGAFRDWAAGDPEVASLFVFSL